MVAANRITFLALFDEFDCKAKFSGKGAVHALGLPRDMLGYFMVRTQMPFCTNSVTCSCYGQVSRALGIRRHGGLIGLSTIWLEIDNPTSTNQSIKAVTLRVFEAHPI